MNSEPEFLLAGKLLKTHGLKGELWLKVITDFPEIFFSETHIFIGPNYKEIEVKEVKPAGDKLLISFLGIDNVNDVRGFVNWNVFFSTLQMPQLPEGDYYIHQLIGLSVFDLENVRIGTLSEVLQTGANDIYVILLDDGNIKEVLIPAIESAIKEIDLDSGKMLVNIDDWLG